MLLYERDEMPGTAAAAAAAGKEERTPLHLISEPVQVQKNAKPLNLLCEEVFDEALTCSPENYDGTGSDYRHRPFVPGFIRQTKDSGMPLEGEVSGETADSSNIAFFDYPYVETANHVPVQTSSQQQILTQFVMNATTNPQGLLGVDQWSCDTGCTEWTEEDALPSALQISSSGNPYQLIDEQSITEMLHVATEADHTFTFIERNNEFCFEPNNPAWKGRSVVLRDLGPLVTVTERYNGVDQSYEEWLKGDWNQFLWAVRGKCMRISYEDVSKTAFF